LGAYIQRELAHEIERDHEHQHGVDAAQPRLAQPLPRAHPDRRRDQDSRHHGGEDREIDIAERIGRQVLGAPAANDRADGGNGARHQPGRRGGGDRALHPHAEGLQRRRGHGAAAGSGERGETADDRRHHELHHALRRLGRGDDAILEKAFVDADHHHESGEDRLQDFGRDPRQQRGSDQDPGEDAKTPRAKEFQIEIAERELLAGRGDRARYDQRHRRPHGNVHHHRMRHPEQRQQVDEDRYPDDAAADAEQARHEARREADERERDDALHNSIHSGSLHTSSAAFSAAALICSARSCGARACSI
jgi:hypothetical protein